MQCARRSGHAGALHPQHHGQEFLREQKFIRLHAVVRHQQPAATSLTYPSDGPVQRLYQSVGFGSILPANEFIDRLVALPLAKQPGTEWEYGLSIDVLGLGAIDD